MENVFEFYDSVKEQEVEWLWYPYIPYGKLTLLEGVAGAHSQRQITVAVENVAAPYIGAINHTFLLAITEKERVEDGTEAQRASLFIK